MGCLASKSNLCLLASQFASHTGDCLLLYQSTLHHRHSSSLFESFQASLPRPSLVGFIHKHRRLNRIKTDYVRHSTMPLQQRVCTYSSRIGDRRSGEVDSRLPIACGRCELEWRKRRERSLQVKRLCSLLLKCEILHRAIPFESYTTSDMNNSS